MNRTPRRHTLAILLEQKMSGAHCKATELAKKLGISQSYFSELLSGDKEFSRLNTNALRNIAAHLEIPCVVCFLLAGKLVSSDFITNLEGLDRVLSEALHEQIISINLPGLLTESCPVSKLSLEVKLLLAVAVSSRVKRAELEATFRQAMSCLTQADVNIQ